MWSKVETLKGNPNEDDKMAKQVVILGMHRTGSSMIAGVLSELGVDMGHDLLGKAWSNPVGHFEDREFIDLNIRIFRAAEGDWDSPPETRTIFSTKSDFEKEIASLIAKRERRSDIWGWKDPKNAFTIELFLSYLSNPHFIVCDRDCTAIASSLHRRDRMEVAEGRNLAKVYQARIDDFFRKYPDLPKLHLKYEHVVNQPQYYVDKIIHFLKIKPSKEQYQSACQLILPRWKILALSRIMLSYTLLREIWRKASRLSKFIFKKLKLTIKRWINPNFFT